MSNNKHRRPELSDIPSIEELQEELAREEIKYNFRRSLRNVAVGLVVAAAITALIATRLLVLIQVAGDSMAPMLKSEEVIFLHQTKNVQAGDVIGFYYGGRILLKRIVACAGDEVDIDQAGNVYINGEELIEPYVIGKKQGTCDVDFPYQVPEGMYFVLGDNRAFSIDSRTRTIGCVEENQIVGKAVFRAWPFDRMGIIH